MFSTQHASEGTKDIYLDIETTGLSPHANRLTVIGLFVPGAGYTGLVAGRDLTRAALIAALEGRERVLTYNGARFDLPFIRERLGVDIKGMEAIRHVDLMYVCRRHGLKGGQKGIERQLGLAREDGGMSGRMAAKLGKKWLEFGDQIALERLVRYNMEDCVNLWKISQVVERLEAELDAVEEKGCGD